MARYMVLRESFLPLPSVAGPQSERRGQIIEYDGPPGTSLHPLDDEARTMVAQRSRLTARYVERQAARYRAALPRNLRAIIEQADRSAGATK